MPEEVKTDVTPDTSHATGDTLLTEGVKATDAKSEGADNRTLLGEAADGDGKDTGKNGEKTDGDGDKAEAKGEVPEKYDLKLPEGLEVDAQMLDGLTPVFKELGLTGEQVQKLAEVYAPLVQKQVEANQKAAIDMWQQTTNTWKEETKKTLGENSAKELGFAAKAIEKSGVKGLREALDETGVGNHPALVQFFSWAGKLVSSDKFVDSSSRGESKREFIDIYDHPTSKATLVR